MSDIPAGQSGEDELDLGEIVDDLEPEPDEPEPEIEDDEPEPDGEEPPEPVTPRQGRRGLAERLRIRLDRAESKLAQLDSRPAPVAQPAIDPAAAQRAEQEFFASLELMPPAEAHRAVWNRAQQMFGQQLLTQRVTTQDQIDKRAYDAEAKTSRVHQQYRQRVEDTLQRERAVGNLGATREDILAWIVGKDSIERANRAAPRQQRAAARRVAGQQTRPGSTRSDGAAGGRVPADSIEAARARIAGKSLWE